MSISVEWNKRLSIMLHFDSRKFGENRSESIKLGENTLTGLLLTIKQSIEDQLKNMVTRATVEIFCGMRRR